MPYPTKRTPKMEKAILDGMSAGVPLAQLCRQEGFPHLSSWATWCRSDEALAIAHAQARDMGHDVIAARTRMTARGLTVAEGGDSTGDVQRDKLIIETDLKLLAKWDSGRYGDKLEIKQKSEVTVRHDLGKLEPDDLDALERLVEKASHDSGDTGGARSPGPDSVH